MHDLKIPALMSAGAARRLLRCAPARVPQLVDEGALSGARVGRLLVVVEADVQALADARAAGFCGWRLPGRRTPLPDLVSAAEAATILNFAQGNWVRAMYRRGTLAGVMVGDDLILRRAVVVAEQVRRTANDGEAER
jgi:hypothetical protein